MRTTLKIAGVTMTVEFELEHNGEVNYSEVNIGGQFIDDNFLHPVVEEQLAEKCREYAAQCAAEAFLMREAA